MSKADLLFVSHDLSWSGAPLILFQIAKWCKETGFFVTAMSPKGRSAARKIPRSGIPLLVDPLIVTGHPSFTAFAQGFDCVIASTILARQSFARPGPRTFLISGGSTKAASPNII